MAHQDQATVDRMNGEVGREEVAAIPLVEERIHINKQMVESGRVRVRVEVDSREETVVETLARDDVEIERIPRNETLNQVPHVRLEGDTTIIPVVEEVLVVEKKLVLVEEIHIRRRSTSEPQEIPVTVRSERAVLERSPAGAPSSSPAEPAS